MMACPGCATLVEVEVEEVDALGNIHHATTGGAKDDTIWPKNCVTCGWHDHGGICRNPHLGVKNYCIIANDWKPKKG